jgi:hypothetical protein
LKQIDFLRSLVGAIDPTRILVVCHDITKHYDFVCRFPNPQIDYIDTMLRSEDDVDVIDTYNKAGTSTQYIRWEDIPPHRYDFMFLLFCPLHTPGVYHVRNQIFLESRRVLKPRGKMIYTRYSATPITMDLLAETIGPPEYMALVQHAVAGGMKHQLDWWSSTFDLKSEANQTAKNRVIAEYIRLGGTDV